MSAARPIRPKVIAIVPAAGSGRRLKVRTKKPFVLLKSKPIIAWTLAALQGCDAISEIIVASEASCVRKLSELVKRFRFNKVSDIIIGGSTRFESVSNCLAEVGSSFDIVLVHDGARPFIDDDTILESIKLASKFGACIVASRETDTVKYTDDTLFISKTLDRNHVFRAETPQVFKYEVIKRAYSVKSKNNITDDASLVERLGLPVKILIGKNCNMKITTKDDIRIAEALL